MTTAVIGTGGIGSVIAREFASDGETLRLRLRPGRWHPLGLRRQHKDSARSDSARSAARSGRSRRVLAMHKNTASLLSARP